MPVQKCPMCLGVKEVVSSHLIPSALYDYCRSADNASPVRVGDGVIMHTDRQTQAYLLCTDCEDILNKGGENWVNRKLATMKQSFPLYDLLVGTIPAFDENGGTLYCANQNPMIDADKLTHFALGIFWKASVHSWRGKHRSPLIQLGPYSDVIRTWLRGESQFPQHISLTVSLSRPERALITFHDPIETKLLEWHAFLLYVPGVQFILSTGRDIDPAMKDTCFHENAAHPIFVSDDLTGQIWAKMAQHYRQARKTRGYVEAQAERAKAAKS